MRDRNEKTPEAAGSGLGGRKMNKYFALGTAFMATLSLMLIGLNVYVLKYPDETGMRIAALHFVAIGALIGSFILYSSATVVLWADD